MAARYLWSYRPQQASVFLYVYRVVHSKHYFGRAVIAVTRKRRAHKKKACRINPGNLPLHPYSAFHFHFATIGRKHKKGKQAQHIQQAIRASQFKPPRTRHRAGHFFRMGQEESSPIDESVPPTCLTSRNLEGVAEYIRAGKARTITVMVGAGISTSAGIPDFRSPETGLYANLARLDLPYAEAVFDIEYFREKPEPFYTLAHELYPGKFRPTITHSFISLLHKKGLLLKLFTQNIDCLEREAGVPGDKIVEAHGSFARQSCIDCKASYPQEEIKEHIAAKTIPRCHECSGLVKPEIVFFGEALPSAFFENRDLAEEGDLCIVMGTSLSVQPFASLPQLAQQGKPRILINQEIVGGLGSRPDDVLLLGDCDTGVRKLAKACGWLEELEALWATTAPKKAFELGQEPRPEKTQDEKLEDEINKLTAEVDETLNLSKWHEEKVRGSNLPAGTASKSDQQPNSSGPPSFNNTLHTDLNGNLSHVFLADARTDSKEKESKI
jgi:NAD-dependent histone deacetylase SIR2